MSFPTQFAASAALGRQERSKLVCVGVFATFFEKKVAPKNFQKRKTKNAPRSRGALSFCCSMYYVGFAEVPHRKAVVLFIKNETRGTDEVSEGFFLAYYYA